MSEDKDLAAQPVEEVEVQRHETPVVSKIGTKEFCDSLYHEFSDGKNVWRTSKALADKLNVDAVDLDNYLRSQQIVCSKPSKEEGVFLYALVKRIEQPAQVTNSKVEAVTRPLVSEEDRYALASLHSSFLLLEAALQKYALKIHERNPEAFTQLVAAKDKLEAGMILFGSRQKADMTKLPKV